MKKAPRATERGLSDTLAYSAPSSDDSRTAVNRTPSPLPQRRIWLRASAVSPFDGRSRRVCTVYLCQPLLYK